MAERHGTAIEWTHRPGTTGETWNPIRARRTLPDGRVVTGWHCEHVTRACEHCYAEKQNVAGFRGGTKLPFKPGHRKDLEIFLDETTLTQPLRWRAPRTIFVCSMTDLFGAWVERKWLDRIFAVMALCPQHIFIVLTKRPERHREYLTRFRPSASWDGFITRDGKSSNDVPRGEPVFAPAAWPLRNVEGGVSVSDQADADLFVPILLDTPLARRFVSHEPALGPVDWTRIGCGGDWRKPRPGACVNALTGEYLVRVGPALKVVGQGPALDQVIFGGESGPEARPPHPDWARQDRDQCAEAGTAFFIKQWGEWLPHGQQIAGAGFNRLGNPDDGRGRWHSFGDGETAWRIGKKRAGRLLDGLEHNGFPGAKDQAQRNPTPSPSPQGGGESARSDERATRNA